MKLLFAACCLGLAAASAARAAPCDGMTDLLTFIADHSAYPVPADCPPVARLVCLQTDASLRSQAGAYFPLTGTIALAPDLDLATPYGRSYLLHELVHAAQYRAGAQHSVRCEADLEAEAYTLQVAYLRTMGEGREALVLSWLAEGLTTCPGTVRPVEY